MNTFLNIAWRKYTFCLSLLLLLYKEGFSQQDPMYSIYIFDKAVINTAYAGSSNWVVGTLKYRKQFTDFPGQPNTQCLTFHTPIQKMHIGTGFKVLRDELGPVSKLNALGMFSYHMNFASGKLSFGIEGGILSQTIAFPELIRTDPIDNAIPNARTTKTIADASAGVYYQKKNLYAGLSVNHLIKGNLSYTNYNPDLRANLFRHYNLLTGKIFDLSKSFAIEPSFLIKYVGGAPLQADLNLNFIAKDVITLGVSYRTGDAVAAIMKLNLTESLRIGYSYDKTISQFSGYTGGAHEIFISYGIKLLPLPQEKEVHPRYYF